MIVVGDCRERLAEMPAKSVQTVVTSPPYFGLRDYGTGGWDGGEAGCDHLKPEGANAGRPGRTFTAQPPYSDRCGKCGARRVDRQIGLEPTPDEFVAALVGVFREVRRVLRDDGTVWLNLGDSYNADGRKGRAHMGEGKNNGYSAWVNKTMEGTKPKDLLGIPWMVAFALRADGWYLRSDIIWNKPNPMPESVTDRPTKSHEYVFLLSKGPRYFWDADAVREDGTSFGRQQSLRTDKIERAAEGIDRQWHGPPEDRYDIPGRNKRSVWTVATQPYAGAHFATFPPKLIEPCVLAGSPPKCCGECGAPWRWVTETSATGPGIECPQDADGWDARRATMSGGPRESSRLHGQYHDVQRSTVGWGSTCAHSDDTGRSVVLDPFAGAGTVGVVCGWHGREHVGIELNPEYAAMAEARIALEGRPGGRPAHHEPVTVVAEQMGLL